MRAPLEHVDQALRQFYDRLLAVLRLPVVREGQWQLLECTAAWQGNWTNDCFLAFAWSGTDETWLLVTVNYANNQSQCYVRQPYSSLGSRQWRMQDMIGNICIDRDGDALQTRGLYLDVSPWQCHVFEMRGA